MYSSRKKKTFININIKNVVNEKTKKRKRITRKKKIVLVKPYLLNHQRYPKQVSFLHYHFLSGFGTPNNNLNPRQRPNNLFSDDRNDNVAFRDENRTPESSAPSWDYERNAPPRRNDITPEELNFEEDITPNYTNY